jgi:hypothetical protein
MLGSMKSDPDDHKTVPKEVCSDLLSHYKADGESFLSLIVTWDETWIHHFEPEIEVMPHGQTINSDLYIQTLKNLQMHLRGVQSYNKCC